MEEDPTSVFSPSAGKEQNTETVVKGHQHTTKAGKLLGRMTPRLPWDHSSGPPRPSTPGSQQRLTYSSLETSLLVALEAMGRAAEHGVGLGCSTTPGMGADSVQDLQCGYDALFDEPGPITLKTETLALLRILQEIRSVKVSTK